MVTGTDSTLSHLNVLYCVPFTQKQKRDGQSLILLRNVHQCRVHIQHLTTKVRYYSALLATAMTVTCTYSTCPLISCAAGQIIISWSSCTVSGCNHKPIYILMSMTLDGSLEWVVLIDAKQRQGGKF